MYQAESTFPDTSWDVKTTIIDDACDGWVDSVIAGSVFNPTLGVESSTLSGFDPTAANGGGWMEFDVTELVKGSDGSGNGHAGFRAV